MRATAATHANRSKVLNALQQSAATMDSYKVSKAIGSSPMQAVRTLFSLKQEGLVTTDDPLDAADNGMAAQFRLVCHD